MLNNSGCLGRHFRAELPLWNMEHRVNAKGNSATRNDTIMTKERDQRDAIGLRLHAKGKSHTVMLRLNALNATARPASS